MPSIRRALRILVFSSWAVVMTCVTYIFGGVSLKVLRRDFGRPVYWGVGTLFSAFLYAFVLKEYGVMFFSLVLLIGVFAEFEEMGLSLKLAAFFSILINSLIAAGAFVIGVYSTGSKWSAKTIGYLETTFKSVTQLSPNVQIDYQELMLVLPSVIVVLWLMALAIAVLLESRFAAEGNGTPAMRTELAEMRMPDAVVWVFILSLLGTFGGFAPKGVETIAANLLNICFMLFFFQGMAVVSRFLQSLRMSPIWQTLFLVLVVVYMFVFVSVLGLSDYWFDFRNRLAKRTEEFNRET